MNQENNIKPTEKYAIENIKTNRCEIVFFDINSIKEETRETENGSELAYKYNTYRMSMNYTDNLKSYIDENYQFLLSKAKDKYKNQKASEMREKRNKLLEETDKSMAFDRLGINLEDFDIPDKITLTNVLEFVKKLAQAVKSFGSIFKNINNSEMAKYRQKLRDITKDENFPFVEFPEKPKDI